MRRGLLSFVVVFVSLGMLSGCVQFNNKRGVEVGWQAEATASLVRGQTTRGEVLELLGPPSQVISLQEETVLYYLFEKAEGEGLILIVYNTIDVDTRYDRAIFFFDENDRLTDFSTRVHKHDNT